MTAPNNVFTDNVTALIERADKTITSVWDQPLSYARVMRMIAIRRELKPISFEDKRPLADTCLNLINKAEGASLAQASYFINFLYDELVAPSNHQLRGKCLEAAFLVLPKILKEGLLQKDNTPNAQKGETSVEDASSLILYTLDAQYEQNKDVQERLFDLRLQTAEALTEKDDHYQRYGTKPFVLLRKAAQTAGEDLKKRAKVLYTATKIIGPALRGFDPDFSNESADYLNFISVLSGITFNDNIPFKARNIFIPRRNEDLQKDSVFPLLYSFTDDTTRAEDVIVHRDASCETIEFYEHQIKGAHEPPLSGLSQEEIAAAPKFFIDDAIYIHSSLQDRLPENTAIVQRARELFAIRNKFPSPCEALARLMAREKVKPELLVQFRKEIAKREKAPKP